jgi:4-amino-4-deoxy-L-arabinose transferase-like glycosyltransferase
MNRLLRFVSIHWLQITVLVLIVIFLRLPSLFEPFGEDSGANAYHARLILDGEALYSTHHPAHHLPAVYYVYALAFKLFGDNTISVKLLLILWTICTAMIIFLIGKRLENDSTGFIAAVFYAILNSHLLLKGNSAETELFANLPISVAILLCIDLTFAGERNWKFSFVGIFCAIAMLFKIVFVSPLIVSFLIIILNAKSQHDNRWDLKKTLQRSVWIGVGFLIPIAIVAVFFTGAGLLPRLLLVFNLGTNYVNQLSSSRNLLFVLFIPFLLLLINNGILLLLSLGGALHIIKKSNRSFYNNQRFTVIGYGILFWFLLSIIIAGITRTMFPHYSIIIIPSLSILAAWELVQIKNRILEVNTFTNINFTSLVYPTLISTALILSVYSNYRYYYHFVMYSIGRETYDDFLIQDNSPENSTPLKMKKISNYIQDNSDSEDFIYSWSDNAQIYYLANRRAPIDIIWPSYAEATGSYKRIFSPQTKIIIVGESILAPKPDWFWDELSRAYKLDTTIGDQKIYLRNN